MVASPLGDGRGHYITKSIIMEYSIEEVRRLEMLYKSTSNQVPVRLKHLYENPSKDNVIIAFGDSPITFKRMFLPAVIEQIKEDSSLCQFAVEWSETAPFWHCGWGVVGNDIHYKGECVGSLKNR